MQRGRVRGFGRVRRRLQLPLLELSCADGGGILASGPYRARQTSGPGSARLRRALHRLSADPDQESGVRHRSEAGSKPRNALRPRRDDHDQSPHVRRALSVRALVTFPHAGPAECRLLCAYLVFGCRIGTTLGQTDTRTRRLASALTFRSTWGLPVTLTGHWSSLRLEPAALRSRLPRKRASV